MFSCIILILRSLTVSEENEATETAATCVELQRELVRQEIGTDQTRNPQHLEEAHQTSRMRYACIVVLPHV